MSVCTVSVIEEDRLGVCLFVCLCMCVCDVEKYMFQYIGHKKCVCVCVAGSADFSVGAVWY